MHEILLDIPATSPSKRCTITSPATGKGRYIRQTSCLGSVGGVVLRIEPYIGPAPILLVWQVTDEQIPEEYMSAVVEGIRQVAQQEQAEYGLLTHIKVIVIDGIFHPIDANSHAYTRAAALAFEQALAQTSLVMLEGDET